MSCHDGLLSRHGGAASFLGCARQERRHLGVDAGVAALGAPSTPEVALESLGDVHCKTADECFAVVGG